MHTTMLHIAHPLDNETRQQLCATFHQHGVDCDVRRHSAKPQLLFVSYDDRLTAPSEITQIAASAGHVAHLVDM